MIYFQDWNSGGALGTDHHDIRGAVWSTSPAVVCRFITFRDFDVSTYANVRIMYNPHNFPLLVMLVIYYCIFKTDNF